MQRLESFRQKLGKQVVVNALLFAALAAAGVWWAYPLLWLLPMLTWYMVVTRIRNIAEHAVVPDSGDPLRNTRTTGELYRAPVRRALFRQLSLEHHLLFFVPCYNLPEMHAILARGPLRGRMEVQPDYATVMRMALSRPANDDRRGALVNNDAAQAGGSRVGEDQAASGF